MLLLYPRGRAAVPECYEVHVSLQDGSIPLLLRRFTTVWHPDQPSPVTSWDPVPTPAPNPPSPTINYPPVTAGTNNLAAKQRPADSLTAQHMGALGCGQQHGGSLHDASPVQATIAACTLAKPPATAVGAAAAAAAAEGCVEQGDQELDDSASASAVDVGSPQLVVSKPCSPKVQQHSPQPSMRCDTGHASCSSDGSNAPATAPDLQCPATCSCNWLPQEVAALRLEVSSSCYRCGRNMAVAH